MSFLVDESCDSKRHGRKLAGCFVVIQPGRVRISRTAV